jgi:lipid-A-disaccharide synthase
MKYYVIAGEASGDLHGANLIKQLKIIDTQSNFRCWGGDKMQAQGVSMVKHIKDLAFMGFAEVILNLGTILKNIRFCKEDILSYQPDALILIDYPGFNLRIAEFAKKNHIKVIYYISPQVWAWKQSRVKKIKATVDSMLVILPFEKNFYAQFDYDVFYTGHPLLDAIEDISGNSNTWNEFTQINLLQNKPVIALLPGSRKQEIASMLPIMLLVEKYFSEYQFVVAAAPSISSEFYKSVIGNSNIKLVYDQTYQLLQHAKAALVTSGTATLETALFNVPEVVCYKGNKISYQIARKLIKVKYISLVNLIMDQEIVKELIQDDLNEINLKENLAKLLDPSYQTQLKTAYHELRIKLGGKGASQRAAIHIKEFLSQ